MSTRKKPSVKNIIKGGKLPERTLPLCLRGDLVGQYEAAAADLVQAQDEGKKSLAGGDVSEIVARMEALHEQMQDSTIDFVLRALPPRKWRDLEDEHPPRQDPETGAVNAADRRYGVDITTFFPALLPLATVSPELDAEDWADLLGEKLTDMQVRALCNVAWNLNKDFISVPFSSAASKTNPSSGTA